MLSARGEAHVTPLRVAASATRGPAAGRLRPLPGAGPRLASAGPARLLPGGPLQAPAADHVRVRVRHLLPGIRAAIEDDAVARTANTLVHRYTVRQAGYLLEQAAASRGDRRDVGVMYFRYDQHMCGCLRIDIPERDSP